MTAIDSPAARTGGHDGPARTLHRVGRRPSLGAYTADLWHRREFVWAWSTAKLKSTNSLDRLGSTWLILTPALTAASFYLIFGLILDTRRGVDNFVGFLVIGVFLFAYTTQCFTTGATAISRNRRLVQAVRFPRAVMPVATVLRALLATAPALAVMVVIVIVTGAAPTWRWIFAVPALALQTLFNLGLALLFARIVASVNDVANLLPFANRIWLYASGVFFAIDSFVDHPVWLRVLQANPMHAYLTLVREPLLYDTTPAAWLWASGVAWGVGLLGVGFIVFWRAEAGYGRE